MNDRSVFADIKKYSTGYRKRILVCMIVFLVAIFVPLVLYGIITDRGIMKQDIESNGRYLVRNLAENSELGVFSENMRYLKTPLEAIPKAHNAVWAVVYNLNGEIILSTTKVQGVDLAFPKEIKALMADWRKDEVQKRILRSGNVEFVDFFFPVYLRTEQPSIEYEELPHKVKVGEMIGIARVGMSLAGLRQRTYEILITAGIFACIYLTLACFAILFIARAIIKPLRHFARGAQEIGKGNLNMRIDISAKDEIGNLAVSFNDMADQLQRQMLQRQQAEKEIARLVSAVEQASEMIIVMDVAGTIEYANPAAEKITGFTPEELISKNPFSLKRGIYKKEAVSSIWKKILKGHIWTGRVSEMRKDGTFCEIDQTISPVRDSAGAILSFVAIGRDITNELKMEEQLRQSQKLEAIGTLAGGIAHDFNNILAAIMGYTEMSLDTSGLGSQLRHNLEQILKSSVRASDLVKQILVFSRKRMFELKPVDLGSIVHEALKLLRATIPTTIQIDQHLPEEQLLIKADPTQMHQIIMNLCTNASQAMSENGGVLDIGLHSIELQDSAYCQSLGLTKGHYAQLTVRDTGPGIAPEVVDHIFEPFFTTKEVGKGTGMGLAVVDGIVKSHEGAIKVYSTPGTGAMFEVLLPQLEDEIKAVAEQEEVPLPTGNECILIVDDEELILDSGANILQSLGYTVVTQRDSTGALETFKRNPRAFDLIITDQTMPHMTGYELAKRILEIRRDIPVLLCTGYSETIFSEKTEQAGITALIYKPIGKQVIARKIRDALDKAAISSPQ